MLWRVGNVGAFRLIRLPGRFATHSKNNSATKDVDESMIGSDEATITIGDVTKRLKQPVHPELVPQKYGKL